MKKITVEITISSSIEKIWKCFTDAKDIVHWYFASDDWCVPYAKNRVEVGGVFKITMAAKDGSTAFDFVGSYTEVIENSKLAYILNDGRTVVVLFEKLSNTETKVTEIFAMETIHDEETQRNGWNAILTNFKKYVEKQS